MQAHVTPNTNRTLKILTAIFKNFQISGKSLGGEDLLRLKSMSESRAVQKCAIMVGAESHDSNASRSDVRDIE
jgi:hypothetical protein